MLMLCSNALVLLMHATFLADCDKRMQSTKPCTRSLPAGAAAWRTRSQRRRRPSSSEAGAALERVASGGTAGDGEAQAKPSKLPGRCRTRGSNEAELFVRRLRAGRRRGRRRRRRSCQTLPRNLGDRSHATELPPMLFTFSDPHSGRGSFWEDLASDEPPHHHVLADILR